MIEGLKGGRVEMLMKRIEGLRVCRVDGVKV
jgi:hypothetical protein